MVKNKNKNKNQFKFPILVIIYILKKNLSSIFKKKKLNDNILLISIFGILAY